jgi:hypothetical protein
MVDSRGLSGRRETSFGTGEIDTIITEMDPEGCDPAWRRQYWKRTQTQGGIMSAGGTVRPRQPHCVSAGGP